MKKIKILSHRSCSGCKQLKEDIKKNGTDEKVEFLDLEKSEEAKRLADKHNITTVPTAIKGNKKCKIFKNNINNKVVFKC